MNMNATTQIESSQSRLPEMEWYYDKRNTTLKERPQRPVGHVDVFIPFIGLYASLDELVENQAFESECETILDSETRPIRKLTGKFDLSGLLRDLTHEFAQMFELKTLEVAYLQTPASQEDKLCCTVSREELWKMYLERDNQIYNKLVSNVCAPCPGYMPYCSTVPSRFYFSSQEELPEDDPAVTELIMIAAAAEHEGDYNLDGTYNECAFWYAHLDPHYVNERLEVDVTYDD